MKVLIVEDEWAAVKQLKTLLKKHLPQAQIVEELDAVDETVKWFEEGNRPDLAFFDIEIADGRSFQIFKETHVPCPVIFATAYDQFMMDAFESNGVAYLLKPINEAKFQAAVQKFTMLTHAQIESITQSEPVHPTNSEPPKRFLSRVADRLIPVSFKDIAWAEVSGKQVLVKTWQNECYPLDLTLDELEQNLPLEDFFRLNRRIISHLNAIEHIYQHLGGKLKVELVPACEEEIFVSREKAGKFKAWLGG
jgi:two-component system LytT family response regulator